MATLPQVGKTNGNGKSLELLKLILTAALAALGAFVAVERRITAVEIKIEERTQMLRERIQLIETRHDRDTQKAQAADERIESMIVRGKR